MTTEKTVNQPPLIPLTPEQTDAINRQNLAIILAAHLLNEGYPLYWNDGTGQLRTEHNGTKLTITVKVTK